MLPSFLLKKNVQHTKSNFFFIGNTVDCWREKLTIYHIDQIQLPACIILKIFHRGAINFFAALSSLSLPSKIGIVWTSRKEFEFSNFNAIWPCIFHSNRKFFNRNCTYENYSMEMRSKRKYTIMRWINCWNFHKNIQLHPLIIRRKWIK